MTDTRNEKPFPGFRPLSEEDVALCSSESRQHLESSMRNLEAGRAPTPSFKLYGKSDISVATDFLKSIEQKSSVDVKPWMLEYEHSREAKWGPQGGYAPWKDLEPDFELYATRPVAVSPIRIGTIENLVRNEFLMNYKKMRISMLGIDQTLAELIASDHIQERAAGWNTFNLKKTDPAAQREAVKLARSGAWKRGLGYVFSRYNKLKKRIFMPMPFSSMIKQATYFVPFLRYIQASLRLDGARSSYTFWADKIGFDSCFEIMAQETKMYHNADLYRLVYVQRDFEKMDTTMSTSQFENFVIPAIAMAFGFDQKSSNYQDLSDTMLFTTKAPIITPSGVLDVDHGTASGAEVTNGGETLGNDFYDRLGEHYLYLELSDSDIPRTHVHKLSSKGNGDDGATVFAVHKSVSLDEFVAKLSAAYDKAAKFCGFRSQASKWHVSEDYGLYCQNWYYMDRGQCRWAYPATLILNSICNPEHEYKPKDWDKDYRDIDIIEKLDNGRGLPYYHELIDYVDNGMKYRLLGQTEQETSRILSKYDKYRSLQPLSERFNRQDYSFSKSPTIAYLLSKRR